MLWRVPKIWEGGDVWIIGGGPSVVRQFEIPDDIVNAVIRGRSPLSTYSPYMEAIHNKHIIGVNVAHRLGPWVDMMLFGDSSFYTRYRVDLAKFSGVKISLHPISKNDPWIKQLKVNGNRSRGISENNSILSWNSNTGAAAINLAVHTGAKRIFLLGFDMGINKDNMQHWHNVYNKGRIDTNDKRKVLPYHKHLLCFPFIAEDMKRLGIPVFNISPDSTIKEFPKISLKEALLL